MTSPGDCGLHASAVAVAEGGGMPRGLLILGPSGSGKSGLALRLLALGARLVADDRTLIALRCGRLIARAPAATRGLIEARGVGLLRAPALDEAALALVVDLGQTETARLPPPRHWRALGCALPLLHAVEGTSFPAALVTYLRHGRSEVP